MNILTIDLEDWFHILAHNETSKPAQWENFESRVERNTDWILDQLSAKNQYATFFCLGWIAKKYPSLIRKINDRGHEIACHSMNHQLAYEQKPGEYRTELADALHLLEDIVGQPVYSYRAPGFSVTENTNWVFEILIECGIKNDCSVFPAKRNHGGYKGFLFREPCLVSTHGKSIREFPMSLSSVAGRTIVYSGGGYFRLLPYAVIKSMTKKSDYVMTYFHPRDFDPGQPMIASLPLKRKIMSYTGLRGARKKFEMLISDFRFTNVRDAVGKIDWDKVPVMTLS